MEGNSLKQIPALDIRQGDSPEVMRSRYLALFRFMRYECKDEIPQDRISSTDALGQLYKCRGNFVMGLRTLLYTVNVDLLFPEDAPIHLIIRSYWDYIAKLDFSKPLHEADVRKVNETLDSIIAYLENL